MKFKKLSLLLESGGDSLLREIAKEIQHQWTIYAAKVRAKSVKNLSDLRKRASGGEPDPVKPPEISFLQFLRRRVTNVSTSRKTQNLVKLLISLKAQDEFIDANDMDLLEYVIRQTYPNVTLEDGEISTRPRKERTY